MHRYMSTINSVSLPSTSTSEKTCSRSDNENKERKEGIHREKIGIKLSFFVE
jgi:hypothetical protein